MFKQIAQPSQNTVGMTINPAELTRQQFLALSDSDTVFTQDIHDDFLFFIRIFRKIPSTNRG